MRMTEEERKKVTNPLKRIRRHCLDCCGDSSHEVDLCPATECWLHDFRLGTNPFKTKRQYSPEYQEELRNRIAKATAAASAARASKQAAGGER